MSLLVGGIFSPLINAFEGAIAFFHDTLGFGWGMSIVCFTFVLRLLILPLSIRGIQKMRAMQAIQPYMKQIQEGFPDDKERQQREMMKLFKEHNVNPFASCGPLLLQMPFFILMLSTLRSSSFKADVTGHGWLFIDDLVSKPSDNVETVVLTALFVITMLGASAVQASRVKDMQTAQKFLMFGLPLIFAASVPRFPTGLALYWVTSNVWTIGQQILVARIAPIPEPPTAEELEAAKPPPKPPRKKRKRR